MWQSWAQDRQAAPQQPHWRSAAGAFCWWNKTACPATKSAASSSRRKRRAACNGWACVTPFNALGPVGLHYAEITAPGGQRVQAALPGQALGLSRFALDEALASAAQSCGATLWTGTSVLDFEQDREVAQDPEFVQEDAAYTLRLRAGAQTSASESPASVRARLVILAAGRHNRLILPQQKLSAAVKDGAHRRRYVGIKCHYADIELPDRVALYFIDGGYAGINPVEDGRANFCMLVTYEAFQQRGKSPAAMLQAVRERHPALDRQLADARMLPETLKTVAAVDPWQPAAPWRGVLCVGDAAAMITPLCGDGMAMALRGAELCAPLADAFLRGQIPQSELARLYARAWHAEFDPRLRIGRLLQSALGQPKLANLLLGVGRAAPLLVRYLVDATRGPSPVHVA